MFVELKNGLSYIARVAMATELMALRSANCGLAGTANCYSGPVNFLEEVGFGASEWVPFYHLMICCTALHISTPKILLKLNVSIFS
jgi:hypothetical protein